MGLRTRSVEPYRYFDGILLTIGQNLAKNEPIKLGDRGATPNMKKLIFPNWKIHSNRKFEIFFHHMGKFDAWVFSALLV